MGKISFRIGPPVSHPYQRLKLDEGPVKEDSARLQPKPGQKPADIPRSITHEDALRYLQDLVDHPKGSSYLNKTPYRIHAMSQRQREAAAIFEKEIERADPTGKLRKEGEFILYFRLRRNKLTGQKEVRANGPIIYCKGGSAEAPENRKTVEGTFLCIHSHPEDGYPKNKYPSRTDFLAARDMKALGMIQYDMVRIAANQYLHYDGSLPPRFSELYDAGPGYLTPPPSPEFMPPPLPPHPTHRLRHV